MSQDSIFSSLVGAREILAAFEGDSFIKVTLSTASIHAAFSLKDLAMKKYVSFCFEP